MKPSLLPPIYHPLRVANMHQRDEFQQAHKGWEREAAEDRELARLISIADFIGPHVVKELEGLGVGKAELEAIHISAENIDSAASHVLNGGPIHDLSSRLDVLSQPTATPEEVMAWKSKWKCRGIYIHWGPEAGIHSPFSGVFVEGCYVSVGRDGPGPDAPIDHYFLTTVCGFRDPSERLGFPLAQEYRRYARALPLLIQANEEVQNIGYTAEQHLEEDEPCFAELWGRHAQPVVDASLSALSFVMSASAQPRSTDVSSLDPDVEIDDKLVDAVRNEDFSILWDEYLAALVKRY